MFAQKLDHVGGGHRRYHARVTHTAKKYELILSFYAHKDRRNARAACVVSYGLIENIFEPLNVKFKYFFEAWNISDSGPSQRDEKSGGRDVFSDLILAENAHFG